MKEVYGYVGEMGSGKTYFALQKVKEMKGNGKTVLMISWADPIKELLNHEFGLLKSGMDNSYNFSNVSHANFIKGIRENILAIAMTLPVELRGEDFQRFGAALFSQSEVLRAIKINISNNLNYSENYRSLIQIVGTELGRCLYDNIWIDTTLNNISLAFEMNIAHCAIIDDIRFTNEFDSLSKFGSSKNYKCTIYGVNADIKTRSARLWIDTEDLRDFQKHESEKHISTLLTQIPNQFQIFN